MCVSHSSPDLDGNTFAHNGVGVYCTSYCSPSFGTKSGSSYFSGNNVVSANQTGVYAELSSNPKAGLVYSTSPILYYYGDNSIFGNSSFDISIGNIANIQAEEDYWGSSPKITMFNGSLDRTYPKSTDPNAGRSLLKAIDSTTILTVPASVASILSDMDSALVRGMKGDFAYANLLYLRLLKGSAADTNKVRRIVAALSDLYEANANPGFPRVLSQEIPPLLPKTSATTSMLAEFNAYWLFKSGRYLEAVVAYQDLHTAYSSIDKNIDKLALYCIVQASTWYTNDASAARSAMGILLQNYPGDPLTLHASTLLNLASSSSLNTPKLAKAAIAIPTEIRLDQNYPNPFNPSTTLRFALSKDLNLKLRIYDVLGGSSSKLRTDDTTRESTRFFGMRVAWPAESI